MNIESKSSWRRNLTLCFWFMTASRVSEDLGTGLERRDLLPHTKCGFKSDTSQHPFLQPQLHAFLYSGLGDVGVPALISLSSSAHWVGWSWLATLHSGVESICSKSGLGCGRSLLVYQVEMHLLISGPS